jgi:hypothetical protein
MLKDFKHIQTAHCENGITTSLLKYHGLDYMNEPLAFGIGSGLFYIQIPFMKINWNWFRAFLYSNTFYENK